MKIEQFNIIIKYNIKTESMLQNPCAVLAYKTIIDGKKYLRLIAKFADSIYYSTKVISIDNSEKVYINFHTQSGTWYRVRKTQMRYFDHMLINKEIDYYLEKLTCNMQYTIYARRT